MLAWPATTPKPWREHISYVAIDMSSGYRAAVRTGLPHATVVVDHFHLVQPANRMLNLMRRRATPALRGRRGRAGDPERKARSRLLRNRENLTDTQFSTMWKQLIGTGDIGMTLLTAWIAKEKLRDPLARSRTTDRHRTGSSPREPPTDSATPPTNAYAHAASPPAGREATSTRLNSKAPQTLPPEFVVRGPAARYAFGNRSGVRLYARTECTVVSRVLRLDV
ncbi:transposase [Streptomyces sp. NPDC048665]|uniref:transposase n=1 Tax=Streptomyces sp. NPDC048665 TaxID=3155490 RepID=UPI003421D49A